jgi:hypothetical protein
MRAMGSYQLRYTHLLCRSHLFVVTIEVLVMICFTLRGVLLLIGNQKLLDTVNLSAY